VLAPFLGGDEMEKLLSAACDLIIAAKVVTPEKLEIPLPVFNALWKAAMDAYAAEHTARGLERSGLTRCVDDESAERGQA